MMHDKAWTHQDVPQYLPSVPDHYNDSIFLMMM